MAESQAVAESPCTKVEVGECIIISAPNWFEREDFLDWRQGRAPSQWCQPACWNSTLRKGEYSDVFMTFDRNPIGQVYHGEEALDYFWEGSDADTLPDDIFETIGEILHTQKSQSGVIWIRP
jgi:hypothetical protein